MRMHLRLLGLSALGLLALAAPARAQQYVDLPAALPGQAVYVPTSNVVTQTTIVRTPIGPTAFVQGPAVVTRSYVPTRYVRTRTVVAPAATYVTPTTYVQTSTLPTVSDPALVPVGYEVVKARKTKVVYPRRVVRYVY